MKSHRILFWTFVLLCAAGSLAAQTPQRTEFGTKFFDDLRRLFGRLQRSELDVAFQQAQAIQCSDLVGDKGEWKQVAFLNDDRRLAAWHFDTIEEVRNDPTRFVFSGTCRGDTGAVKLTTSYPVQETLDQSLVVMRDNAPVPVLFDRSTQAYMFQLPYLYVSRRNGPDVVYTLLPPRLGSKHESDVAEDFRCKALGDPELTYRFLLCRAELVDRYPGVQKRSTIKTPGSAAYQIFSDGREAISTVKLTFENGVEALPATPPTPERVWRAPDPKTSLAQIAGGEFRLRFNETIWTAGTGKPQLLINGAVSDLGSPAGVSSDHCIWRTTGFPRLQQSDVLYSLTLRSERESAISATFEMKNGGGTSVGTLQCHLPAVRTPDDLVVNRWLSIVGVNVSLEVPRF